MMATSVYEYGYVELVDGTVLEITPLKIRYMRDFMREFEGIKEASGDDQAITCLAKCCLIAMRQYMPEIKTVEDLEDSLDLPTLYLILELAAGIKINADREDETVKDQATNSGASWDTLDLAKLESEVFILGIWKDYEELEKSLSMPELVATLESKRELDYDEKKFLAAIQGVDLDAQTGKSSQDPWEEMKARVFSNGQASDANDILSFQGIKASKAGLGIGNGLDYEKWD